MEISVYPNPTNGLCTIQFSNRSKDDTLIIYDAQGKLVLQCYVSSKSTTTLDVSNLQSGLYHISSLASGLSTKLIVE